MKKKYRELLEKFLAKNESDLEKMSRPRLQFPNLNIPTRLDQEIKPIGTERQKDIHARTVAETATRTAPQVQRIADPKRRQAVIEDARKDVVKQVKGSFGRGGTMGHIIPVAGKQYGAALVGKEYSKYDPALKEVAKQKEAAKLGEYKNKYDKWKQELQSKPQGSTDYWNHLANKPKEPRKSPIPKTDTKKLSPEAQIARGKAQEMITEHEAAHMAFGHIKDKYPKKYHGIMRHLMDSFSPEVRNSLIDATAKRYNPRSPHFYEEVVNHARDILVDKRMRDNFLRNTKGDQKLVSGVKQGWNEAVRRAKKLTPEFGKSELNKAPKERLSGITTGKLKQLAEDHYHNPDTGLEVVPEAAHQEIARRAENKAPKMIADYKRKLKPQKPSGENPEDWFGKGAKGDWQKEGYTLSHTSYPHSKREGVTVHEINAFDKNKTPVGNYSFHDYESGFDGPYSGKLIPIDVDTDLEHQRKGLASKAYEIVEGKTGKHLTPSNAQLSDAKALWSQPNRPFGKKESLIGGKGDKKKISEFSPKEAKMGRKVELEHTKSPKIAEEITRDHLTENPRYYSKLKQAGLADELEKGHFSGVKATESPEKAITNWIGGKSSDERRQYREKIKPISGDLREKALHRLHAKTEVRRNTKTGEREFLLHRGTGKLENKKGRAATGKFSSWTPYRNVAEQFDSANRGGVISQWVPESAIHHIPMHSLNSANYTNFNPEHEVLVSNQRIEGENVPTQESQKQRFTPSEDLNARISHRGGILNDAWKQYNNNPKQILQDRKKSLQKALPSAPKVNLNPEHGKIIANAYENMKHDPNHPHVKAAYNALAHETGKQYQNLLSQGYKFSPMKPGMENPYKTSKDMHADIANNKHLWYFPTEQGYGSEGDASSDHPLLAPSKFKDKNGNVMPHNDVFRAVHDIMGHHLGGQSSFGPKGEHQAYLTHKKTFSPLAQKALASETLMQNSWVNFGPHAAHNRANPQNTIFADQKAGLPPDNILNGNWHE